VDLSWGETVVKFHFTHSKQRGQPFFAKTLIGKYQISKSMGFWPISALPFLRPWSQEVGLPIYQWISQISANLFQFDLLLLFKHKHAIPRLIVGKRARVSSLTEKCCTF